MAKRASCFGLALGLGALSCVFALTGGVWAKGPRQEAEIVTVELFTSQGCASCPPADAYVGELAKRSDILALSLPVDYWDYLGWRDTLATPENTKRQYAYAEKLGTQRPYTPQIVVDGRYDCVGSDKGKVEFAIRRFSRDKEPRVPVAVMQTAGMVTVSVGSLAVQKKQTARPHATVWLVRYEPARKVPIEKGENEGRTLTYTNVVRDWSPLGMWDGAPISFKLSRPDLDGEQSGFAVLVQQDGTGPILGAARFSIDAETP